jgi:hypothetical protein
MGTLNHKRLSVYLNDHLAGATGGVELVKRIHQENEGTSYSEALARLEHEIEEDRETLTAIMERLDVEQNQFKVSLGWIGEKLGRLKVNDQLIGYSPLSRLVELEAMTLGVTGKLAMWKVLQHVAGGDGRLAEFDLGELIARADRQQSELETLRLRAADEALTAESHVVSSTA